MGSILPWMNHKGMATTHGERTSNSDNLEKHSHLKENQPFTPEQEQWMRVTIKELWIFAISVRNQYNKEIHGPDGAISRKK
jgi:hypothetical protein